MQVQEFLRQFRHTAPSDALYIVGFGGNDAFALFQKLGELLDEGKLFDENGEFTIAAQIEIGTRVTAALTEIGASLQILCDAGADTIVVANVPNIAISPAIPDEARDLGTFITSVFNFGPDLTGGIQGLVNNPPGACADASKTIVLLDLFHLTNRFIFNDPTLINPATGGSFERGACLKPVPGVPFGDFDEPCDRYFINDFVHPTGAAHSLIADEFLALIGH